MILKERTVPLNIKKLEALLRRLPNNHSQRFRIEEDLAKFRAGYHGEKSIDYHLSFFNKERYIIIHDVRLIDNEKRFFQIDTIVLSPSMLIILEVKNISGTLYFDQSFNQLIRIIDGKEESFSNPLVQVERQKLQLRTWLKNYKYSNFPIVPLVVLCNPKSIIKASLNQREISKYVIHSEILYKKIEELECKYQSDLYSSREIRKIAKLLIKQNQFFDQNTIKKYNINQDEILTGVICEKCNAYSMKRIKGAWFCSQCSNTSKVAHLSALQDYFLIMGNTITNYQLRHFLQISSIYTASRILTSLKLTSSGKRKAKVYFLDELSEQ